MAKLPKNMAMEIDALNVVALLDDAVV